MDVATTKMRDRGRSLRALSSSVFLLYGSLYSLHTPHTSSLNAPFPAIPLSHRSGIFGSGLVTLSRWPLLESGFHLYSSQGDPLALTCGDYLAAKGYGWARLSSPSGPLDVFNTHLHANYSHKIKGSTHHHLGGGPSEEKGQGAASRGADGSDQNGIQIPLDDFAPFRILQMWELAQV